MTIADQLMDTAEVAALLGVSARSLTQMRSAAHRYPRIAGMPDPIRHIGNSPVWARTDIDEWIAR